MYEFRGSCENYWHTISAQSKYFHHLFPATQGDNNSDLIKPPFPINQYMKANPRFKASPPQQQAHK